MRNQFRAWASFMGAGMTEAGDRAVHLSRGAAAGREALGRMVRACSPRTAHYWVPLTRNQPDAEFHTSLAYEDKLLLRLRIERLRRRPPSQHPESWSQHVLQAPEIEAADGDSWQTRTAFHYAEARGDAMQMLTGVALASPGAAGRRVAHPVEAGEPAELRRGAAVDSVVSVDAVPRIDSPRSIFHDSSPIQSLRLPPSPRPQSRARPPFLLVLPETARAYGIAPPRSRMPKPPRRSRVCARLRRGRLRPGPSRRTDAGEPAGVLFPLAGAERSRRGRGAAEPGAAAGGTGIPRAAQRDRAGRRRRRRIWTRCDPWRRTFRSSPTMHRRRLRRGSTARRRPEPATECALLYTSGTTGRPKGCVLSNDYYLRAGHWYATVGGLVRIARGRPPDHAAAADAHERHGLTPPWR